MLSIATSVKLKTRIIDTATGAIIKERPWENNLVLDAGLNSMAKLASGLGSTPPAGSFASCKIGSGTTPTAIASGAITFTQVTNQVTASGGFFTAAMVGSIFKYGTGSAGAEYYITAFTSSTLVTVDTSITVSTPTVATVWNVQQTALTTQLFQSSTYQTTSGSCGTTQSTNTLTFQRTFIFTAQASPYTVNEIGWAPAAGTLVGGRIVLASSDSVSPTNTYIVVIALTCTFTPGAPTAVGNVGTNIDTSGNAMVEALGPGLSLSLATVDSTGATTASRSLDGSPARVVGATVTYTQNATPATSYSLTWTVTELAASPGGAWTNQAGVRGECRSTLAYSVNTTGQTFFGIGISNQAPPAPIFDIKLTTPFVTPNGLFSGTIVFRCVFGRILVN